MKRLGNSILFYECKCIYIIYSDIHTYNYNLWGHTCKILLIIILLCKYYKLFRFMRNIKQVERLKNIQYLENIIMFKLLIVLQNNKKKSEYFNL